MTNLSNYLAQVNRIAHEAGYPYLIEACGFVFDCLDFGKPARVCAQKYVDDYNRVVLGK